MATTFRTSIPGLLNARSPRMMPQQDQGFPVAMIQNLFLFREANLSAGLKDEITGLSYLTRNGTMQGGGGIQFVEGAVLGPTIDVRQPFTIATMLTMAPPSGGGLQARRALLSVGDPEQNGFLVWTQGLDTSRYEAGAPYGVYIRQTIDGGFAPFWPGISWMDSPALYGKPMLLVVIHEGNGSIIMQVCRKVPNSDGVVIQQTATEWDVSKLGGNPGGLRSYNLPVKPGTINGIPDYAPSSAVYDSLLVARMAHNDTEVITTTRAGAALAAARGRAA